MEDLIKKYAKVKGKEKDFGYCRKDEDGRLYVETLNGIIIYELAYNYMDELQSNLFNGKHPYEKHVGKIVSIGYGICDTNTGCELGKPKQTCIDSGCYSKNKCACVFLDSITDDFVFKFSANELQLFLAER